MRSPQRRGHALAIAAALGLAVFGCGDDDFELEPCDLASPRCPDGTVCRTVDGAAAYCLADCAGAGGDCPEGATCHVFGDGSGSCVYPCEPRAERPCAEGFVCEPHEGEVMLCALPLVMNGQVFDLTDLAAIGGARVVASDPSGAPVTDVAVTDPAGGYELAVPAARDADGLPAQIFTLRVSAADYLPYPSGIRPPIPVDASEALRGDHGFVLDNPTTDVGLIPLPEDRRGLGAISGAVRAAAPGGALVVAEGAASPAPFGFADLSGDYAIFNVPAGRYDVHGYAASLQLVPVGATVAEGELLEGVDLVESGEQTVTVSGQVNIVNAAGDLATSVVLVPESTYDDTFVRGEVPPGLRAPASGLAPSIRGAFAIEGVPDGEYVVLAAFENDMLVRDPDPNIAGTQIVRIVVPAAGGGDIALPVSFKITEALHVVSPGAEAPEAVAGSPTFVFLDDSSEDYYSLVVYDAFGVLVWQDPAVARVTGSATVEVPYGGEPLEPGMYYQFRATSWRREGPISTTEDLRGVFYLPGAGR